MSNIANGFGHQNAQGVVPLWIGPDGAEQLYPTATNGFPVTPTTTGPAGTPNTAVESVQGVPGGTPVSVSATSLPLPTGAATAANQAPPGTAGNPNAAVTSVQGVAGGTPVPVSGNFSPAVPTTLSSGQTTVTTTAAQFWPGYTTGAGTASVINTDSTNSVWIGPAGVTITTGYLVPSGGSATFDPRLATYAVCSAGAPVIDWIGAH